jgi:hypothetical protein
MGPMAGLSRIPVFCSTPAARATACSPSTAIFFIYAREPNNNSPITIVTISITP